MIDALADVARWTGSSENSQPWRFIVITEPSTLRAIHEAAALTRGLATALRRSRSRAVRPGRAVHDAYDEGRVDRADPRRRRDVDSAPGSAGSRTSGRRSAASSACRRTGWSGRSSSSAIPTEAARPPKTAPGEARLPRDEIVFRERWPRAERSATYRLLTFRAIARRGGAILRRDADRAVSSAAVKSILVVDDERNIVDLLRLYLEKEGFAVVAAARRRAGARAPRAARARPRDPRPDAARSSTASRSAARSAGAATRR